VGKPAPFLLSTVHHTGTHTAIEIFKSDYKRCAITEDGLRDYEPYEGEPYWFSHCEPEQMRLICKRLKTGIPLILTMRNPMDVARSWIKRGAIMDGLFMNMWKNLFALQEAYNGLWLPVDTPDRDMRLQAISERLGVDLSTDWTPQNVTKDNFPIQGGMSLDDCKEFYKSLPFGEFYTEK
jgi:hypothetical protein